MNQPQKVVNTPAVTQQFARQIERVDIDYTRSRLGGMQAAPDNPLGIEIRQFGQATAFLIAGWPDFWYGNRGLGLTPADAPHLDKIAAFFDRHNLSFRFEIIPGSLNRELARRLNDLGFMQVGFSAALYGRPHLPPAAAAPVRVKKISSNDLNLFIDLYKDGFEQTPLSNHVKEIVSIWHMQEQAFLDLYIAYIDSIPAGVGILYSKNGVGLLADAAVLPRYRGQGCHTALIHQRTKRAIEQGCTLLTSFVEFGSASHRNLEKAGLRVAYTKAVWRKA